MSAGRDKKFMDSSSGRIKLHFDILPKETKNALDFLSAQEWLGETDWYLAGGTALALQVGHRRSVDLDFFTKHSRFDNVDLLDRVSFGGNLEIELNKDNTILAKLLGAKISIIAYPFFLPQQGFMNYGAVKILLSTDIAVMKIIAISQRGRKRDFFDLYWCAKNLEPLEDTIRKLPAQYPAVAHNYHHILKAMVYFEDAESDPEPEIFFKVSWQEVKLFFNKEIPTIAKKLIGLH